MTDLRATPTQARAVGRLKTIEDAARAALRLYGRDRLTTGQVATIAGCSIGTVYRYFPDRIAILDHIWPDRDKSFPATDTDGVDVGDEVTIAGEIIAKDAETVTLRVHHPGEPTTAS